MRGADRDDPRPEVVLVLRGVIARGPRRGWRARLRRPVARAEHVLLRPRIDVLLDDDTSRRADDASAAADEATSPAGGGRVAEPAR